MQPTLTTELLRFFILSAPHAIVCTIATLLLLGEEIKPQLRQIVLYGVLAALATIITFVSMPELVVVKIILNAVAYLLFLKLIFKRNWKETFIRFIFIFFVVTFIVELIALLIFYPLANMNYETMAFDFYHMAVVYWPTLAIMLFVAWLARRFGLQVQPMIRRFKATYYNPEVKVVYIALLIQTAIFMILMWEVIFRFSWEGHSQWEFLSICIAVVTVLLASFFVFIRTSSSAEKRIMAYAEQSVSDQVLDLVRSVRGQRHDFLNHIMVIQALNESQDFASLDRYLVKLGGSVRQINDILKINNMFIGALLNAKMAQAETKGVEFEVDVQADLADYGSRSIDLVRILGNLINNALDVVEKQEGKRYIRVEVMPNGPFNQFTVANSGTVESAVTEYLFEPGYTTKSGQHEGLGLYIAKQLVERLGGGIQLKVDASPETRFIFAVPKA